METVQFTPLSGFRGGFHLRGAMSWWFSHTWHHINQIADQKEKTEGAKGKLPSSHGEIEERMGAVRPLGTMTARQRGKEGGRWRSQLAHGFRPMRSTTAANTRPHLSLLIAPLSPPTRSSGIRGQIRRIHLELLLFGPGFPSPASLLRSVEPAAPILVAAGHGGGRHEAERASRRRCTAGGGWHHAC
jgi:hypothetical protein